MKTGALFAAACELGAFINEASPDVISALRTFGMRLGTAYQIYDDVVDLAGDEAQVGKTLGSDLRKGKLTLPILHLLQHADDAERQRLSAALRDALALGGAAASEAVRTLLDPYWGFGRVRQGEALRDLLPAARTPGA